jgi:hypothetical protein
MRVSRRIGGGGRKGPPLLKRGEVTNLRKTGSSGSIPDTLNVKKFLTAKLVWNTGLWVCET